MSTIHEKVLASLINRIFANPAMAQLLKDDQLVKDVLRECSIIMIEKTSASSVDQKAETARKLTPYPCKKILDNPDTTKRWHRLLFCDNNEEVATYYTDTDCTIFLQPIFEEGYTPCKIWCLNDEDQKHIIGFIPTREECNYSSVEIKSQWLSKIRKNAGTKNGIELSYSTDPDYVEFMISRKKYIPYQIEESEESEVEEAEEEAESEEVAE
jgi:hypothetical protein